MRSVASIASLFSVGLFGLLLSDVFRGFSTSGQLAAGNEQLTFDLFPTIILVLSLASLGMAVILSWKVFLRS